MRFQAFAVIFIAIILPISMVLSYYIDMQSETIALESQYQSRLNNATYSAVSAYQMNSLNTQRVAGESIYSYVDASINTFYTTLATSMLQSNASKNMFKNYIPAILFTTYDGYYIYSPYKAAVAAVNKSNGQNVLTNTKEIVYMSNKTTKDYRIPKEDAEAISNKSPAQLSQEYTTDVTKARMDYNYKLKPFIYYSAEYLSDNCDFVASYSLDNYLTVAGKTNNGGTTKSFSKSGYAINPEDVSIKGDFLVRTCRRGNDGKSLASELKNDTAKNTIDYESLNDYYKKANDPVKFKSYKVEINKGNVITDPIEAFIQDYTKNSGKNDKVTEDSEDYFFAQVSTKEDLNSTTLTRYQTGDRLINDTILIYEWLKETGNDYDNMIIGNTPISDIQVEYKGVAITDPDAKKYYIKAYYFSKWVTDNLKNVTEGNVHENKQISNEKNKVDIISNASVYDYFEGSNAQIFNFGPGNDPSSDKSIFATHKASIIKNSIQTNLNAAISNFNEDRKVDVNSEYTYRMPILTSEDWDNILNNVCMVAFMQGIPTGYNRKFNNYAVVKSSNNNTYVTPDSLCFVAASELESGENTISNENFHKLNCPDLGTLGNENEDIVGDRSAEFKYDARRINSLVSATDSRPNPTIIAFEDDDTHTFFKPQLVEGTTEYTIGEKISNPAEYQFGSDTYNLTDPNRVITGSVVKYLFDHRHLGCYNCIISGNYTPVVKYYGGDLYLTGINPRTGEIYIKYGNKWLNEDGSEYTGQDVPQVILDNAVTYVGRVCSNTTLELNKRRKALFNMLGKYKETQYKNNQYINL